MIAANEALVFAANHGASINVHGGFYRSGQQYGLSKKLEVAYAYKNARDENNGRRPNKSAIARDCKVSRAYIAKIEYELEEHGRILDPQEVTAMTVIPMGPGAKSLTNQEIAYIYILFLVEPYRTLASYVEQLFLFLGTRVHESTISRLFNHGFPIKGSLCKPNLVPFDKFKPENIARVYDYLQILCQVAPHQVKYGDEKHLKGKDLYCRKSRRDVLTGLICPVLVAGDFRNAYTITGFCGINRKTSPFAATIVSENNNAESFFNQLCAIIQSGFFQPGDVLVLDRAPIHTGGMNQTIEDWLWDNFGVLLLFLPARCPELNPIELAWRSMVARMKTYPMQLVRQMGSDSTAIVAAEVARDFTYEDIEKMYKQCGLMQ